VNGIDLYTNVVVNSLEAMVGCDKSLKGLDNKEFTFTIPSGTQPDTKLRLMGQGLWMMNQNVRGNLIVNVKIVTPTLTPKQLELAKDLLSAINQS
jgi:molecular chaperone DnaJ